MLGRPALPRELQRRFWLMMRTGVVLDDAAATVGVSKAVAWRWFREAGGVLPALAPDHPEFTWQDWLNTVHPGDRDRVRAALRESIERTHTWEIEFRVVWPDGSVRCHPVAWLAHCAAAITGSAN